MKYLRTKSIRVRRGITSVLAMMYLSIIAMLAVGFYSAVNMGSSIADNEQFIHRSSAAAEVGLAFARYQISQLNLPGTTTQSNLLSAVYSALATNLNSTSNMGGNNPTTQPSGTPTSIYVPGLASGSPTWMSTDSQGGQTYFKITNPAGMTLRILAVGQNSNSKITAVSRKLQLDFPASGGANPIFTYGLVSYGEIMLNGGLTVNGNNGGVMSITAGTPINVNGANSFGGDFYWTSATPRLSVTWGSLRVSTVANAPGYLSASGQFPNHVHGAQTVPSKPTFDSSAFLTYVGTGAGYGGSTFTTGTYSSNAATLTNTILSAGNYSFNNALTINGILYLQSGVNVNFNNNVTINGAIVQANASSAGTINFSGTMTQTAYSGLSGANFPAAELALTGTALLLPSDNITFNKSINAVGSVIGGNLIFDANAVVNGGSVMNMGTSQMIFNNTATITVTTTGNAPAGVSGNSNYTFAASPTTYTEVYP